MSPPNFRTLDLNLLRVFDEVMAEGRRIAWRSRLRASRTGKSHTTQTRCREKRQKSPSSLRASSAGLRLLLSFCLQIKKPLKQRPCSLCGDVLTRLLRQTNTGLRPAERQLTRIIRARMKKPPPPSVTGVGDEHQSGFKRSGSQRMAPASPSDEPIQCAALPAEVLPSRLG